MKIRTATQFTAHIVITEDTPRTLYTRYGSDNWYERMGESDEPVYHCAELEAEFQRYMAAQAKKTP